MVADDNALDINDNVNTRDQNRVGVWFIVVVVIFIAFLVALGVGHAPRNITSSGSGEAEMVNGNAPGGEPVSEFSVNSPAGELELPGTVGKEQHYVLNGHGNTPAQGETQGVGANTVENPASTKKATSGTAQSDVMPTGKNYKNGAKSGGAGGGAMPGSQNNAPSSTNGAGTDTNK